MTAAKKLDSKSAGKPSRIILVDDHPLLTSGIARIMTERGWEIVAEHADSKSVSASVSGLNPAVVVTDIVMPGPDIIETLVAMRQAGASFRLIVLSAYFSDLNLSRVFRANAEGIVSKVDGPQQLLAAMDEVLAGRKFVSQSLRDQFVDASYQDLKQRFSVKNLTIREIEILRLFGGGMSIKAIAGTLVISPKTVDRHRTNIMAKLNIHRQVDLVRYAIREQVVEP